MSEYIDTFRACNMLGISLAHSYRMNEMKIRSKKNLSYKLWNLDDIQEVLKFRESRKEPPDGWIRVADAARILGWSEPVSRSILLAHGLTPKVFKLWTKGNSFRQIPCWNKNAVYKVKKELDKGNRKHPPEGWLTFADCMDYLGAGKERTHFWLRKFKVGFKRVTNRRFFYAEDDVVALRKKIKTPNKPLY